MDIEVLIEAAGKTAPGLVQRREFSKLERLGRAGEIGLLFFALTAFSFFIPILHFVLAPLLLIITIVFSSFRFSQKYILLGGSGHCPACHCELKIEGGPDRWPFKDLCENCSREVLIKEKD